MNLYIKKENFVVKKIMIKSIILVLILAFLYIFGGQIKNSFYVISSPISKNLWESGKVTSNFFESFFASADLKNKNNGLHQENQKLLLEISFLKDFLRANYELQQALQTGQTNNFSLVPTQTIELDSLNDFILVNKGQEDGIVENMPVISSNGVLYGKIYKVHKNFSEVMLISNKLSVLDVKIQNDDPSLIPVYGAIKGNGSLSLYLDLVSSDAPLKERDILVSSALEGLFPKNLLVGEILSENKNDLKPFKTAEVRPFFDIKNIDNLFIITDYLKK
ncbi:MAG: hypothetical protein A2980_00685 [Candidatus Staskawiczbacteria bacterium RIFCSPLOWO2_01_FULL_33_13]|nr:MAG: hypothetical protein A2980_00685 [Candidatus Staskawiczbacteria bacterium RIFCSPLOWO2_01_FULL_33_13]